MDIHQDRTIQLRGAAGSVSLMQLIAEDYMMRHPEQGAVLVSGGGTYRGYKAMIDDTASLGMVASTIPGALDKIARQRGVTLAAPRYYGVTAVVAITHPDNPLRELSTQQLRDIFSGRIRRWQDVGGPKLPIQVCSPSLLASETELWREKILGSYAVISADAQISSTGSKLVDEVMKNRQAIGFVAREKISGQQSVNILRIDGIEAGVAEVRSGHYPVIQRIGVVHRTQTSARLQAFLDFLLKSVTLERFQPQTRMLLGGNALITGDIT